MPPKGARTRVPGHSAASTSASARTIRVESSSVQAVQFFVEGCALQPHVKTAVHRAGLEIRARPQIHRTRQPAELVEPAPRPVAMLIISKVS